MVVLGILSILLVAIIAKAFGDFWGWVALSIVVITVFVAWPLNKWIFRPKTLHNDQEREDAGEARRQEIDYEKHDYDPHH